MPAFLVRKSSSRFISAAVAVLMVFSIVFTGLVLPIEARADQNQVTVPPAPDQGGWNTAVASHYGTGDGFLGQRCANGDILNETDMTFAHKKMAFGTVIEFEFNGKKATARCNDRGPYIFGRDFDFGPALARALGFSGVHPIRWRLATGGIPEPAVQSGPSNGVYPIVFPVAGPNSYTSSFHYKRSGPPNRADQHRNAPGNRAHEGIDIFAAKGTPVVASVSGRIECRYGSSAGIYVRLVADDGTTYLFLHLAGYAPGIQEGVRVNAGDVIGYVGNTGNAVSTPPHVHYEIKPPYKHLCTQCNPHTWTTPIDPYPSLKAAESGIIVPQPQTLNFNPGLSPKDGSTVFGKIKVTANPPMVYEIGKEIAKVQFNIDGKLVAEDIKPVSPPDGDFVDDNDANNTAAPPAGTDTVTANTAGQTTPTAADLVAQGMPVPVPVTSTYEWNSEEYADGPHTIQVKAIDVSGNEGWSETHNVVVKPQDRTAGDNVYATSALISQKGWADGANAVVLVRGDNGAYEDAMVAPALCKKYNAPMLFTDPTTLSPETSQEIDRLFQNQNIKRVFIIGQSISAEIEKGLAERGITVSRIAGSDKYDTSAKVAEEAGALSKTAVIVSEYSYEDAVSMSAASYTKQMPILLAKGEDGFSSNTVPQRTQEALKSLGVQNTVIVGDEKAVGPDVEKWLAENGFNPRRIGGSDKYETSALIAGDSLLGLSAEEPYIVSTEDKAYFADGFAGGVLAARKGVSPILLVSEPLSESVDSYLFSTDTAKIHIIGGQNMIAGFESAPPRTEK